MYSFKGISLLALATAFTVISARPARTDYAKIVSRQEIQDEYDYIIVGGGTSGLTVGDRLTENGECGQHHALSLSVVSR